MLFCVVSGRDICTITGSLLLMTNPQGTPRAALYDGFIALLEFMLLPFFFPHPYRGTDKPNNRCHQHDQFHLS